MTEQELRNEEYDRKMYLKRGLIVLTCASLLILSLLISMNAGHFKLSPLGTLRTLFGNGTDKEKLILFDLRLPRIVISMLIGMGLAISGSIIQSVSKNPLADPGLLGINAGAGMMVIIFTVTSGSKTMTSIFTLPFLALIGAGITAILIYFLSYKKDEGITPMRLVLTGIGVQAGITALTTLLVVKLDDTQFNMVATWQAGSIWGSNWKFVLALLPWFAALIPYVLYKSKVLDVLNFGDEISCGLGLSVERERRRLLAVSVALAASCVSVGGNIGFVGLIAPHVARRLVGPRNSILIPTSGLIGAVLVSASDTIARVILPTSEIPTGIVVAIIGAPYFLYLLSKSRY